MEFLTSIFGSTDTLITALVMLALLAFVVVYLLVRRRKQSVTDKIGAHGEARVAKALTRYARRHHCHAMHDVYLPLYDKTTQLDHLLIGDFGVIVIETKATNGDVYGKGKDRQWTHLIGTKKHELYNPLLQNQAHIDCVNHLFKKNHIYKVPVQSLVIFAGKNINLNLEKGLPVIKLSALKKHLFTHTKNRHVDADEVRDFFESIQVTDKKKLKKHTQNVKIMASKRR